MALLWTFARFPIVPDPCEIVLSTFRECPVLESAAAKLPRITTPPKLVQEEAPDFFDLPPRLRLLYLEAYAEIGLTGVKIDHDYSIYPRRFYRRVQSMDSEKVYDFCFSGSLYIDEATTKNRRWILEFIDRHFTSNSFLSISDFGPSSNFSYTPRGSFDHSRERDVFIPKKMKTIEGRDQFDELYFKMLNQCQFCLCPAGDAPYSMRFVEVLMSRCIPIVNKTSETYRSMAENQLDYHFLYTDTPSSSFAYSDEHARHNYAIFLQHHTLDDGRPRGEF